LSRRAGARTPRATSPTIADVAAAAKVSASTASRAFNHPHLLREETVTRVKAAADALGFRHNQHAKALSTGRSSALGLIVPDLSNPFFPPLVHAAQLTAESQRYSLYILSSERNAARERQLATVVSRDVAGLILASPRMSTPHIQEVAEQVPTVLINRQIRGMSSVLVSAAPAITDAVAKAAEHKIAGIAYIGSDEQWWPNIERESRAREEAAKRSLPYRRLRLSEPTYENARKLMLSMDYRPGELLIAFDDIVAHGVVDGMGARGHHAPRDYRVLGCDDALPINTHPALATVHLDTRTAARIAVDLLLAQARGDEAQNVAVTGVYRRGQTI